ncbi:MAG: hypothetical protein JWP29_2951, partial [Rhodoferax sp.]|nr:hypothetical protein [Rhodoferax sp.]
MTHVKTPDARRRSLVRATSTLGIATAAMGFPALHALGLTRMFA